MKLFDYLSFRVKLLPIANLVIWAAIQSTCFSEEIRFTIATPSIPPFYYLDDEKNPQGVIHTLFFLVESQTDIKIDIVIMPWARALKEVQNGKIDALLGARYSEERALFLVYPNTPIMTFKTLLFKRKDDNIDLNDVNNPLLELTIATVRSMQLNEPFYNMMTQGKNRVIEVVDFNSAIKMLNMKRIDLVVGNEFIGESLIKQMGFQEKIAVMTYLEHETPVYIAFSKEYAAQHNVNEIMLKIKLVIDSNLFQKQLQKSLQIKNLENKKE
jgi:polar amino acid transport system substrate-binding protein